MREQSTRRCECGCGEFTLLMPRNNTRHGWVKGQPFRFVRGHQGRVKLAMEWSDALWIPVDHGFVSECFIYQRARDVNGYGIFASRHRIQTSRLAHVESYVRAFGPVPEGCEIDHLCHVPSCVNPAHLEAVPHIVNMRRGRGTKLNFKTATEIRERHAMTGETHQQLAAAYGVEKRTIYEILKGKRWTH